MINLFAIIPDNADATAWYRSSGPISNLRRQWKELQPSIHTKIAWPSIKFSDLIFLQRPYDLPELTIAQMTKQFNRPLWIDYDDDFFNIPLSNPAYGHYNRPGIQDTILNIISLADLITVSTEQLKTIILSKSPNSNVVVVENAFDTDLLALIDNKERIREPTIRWRGGNTHAEDLKSIADELVEIATTMNTFNFDFIGYMPYFLVERVLAKHGAKINYQGFMDLHNYWLYLASRMPSYFTNPLTDNLFNKSKSNIAWIEATMLGRSPILVPNLPEWDKPGAIVYNNAEDFRDKLISLVKGKIGQDAVQRSSEYILNSLDLDKINKKRRTAIEQILK